MGRTRKKKLGSYPFVSVVFSITLALFVIGLFGLLVLFTGNLTNQIRENVEVQVYLDKYLTENDLIKIQKIIGEKKYISRSESGPAITLITKEEAAETFIKQTGEDFTGFLGDNPLRDAVVIGIDKSFQKADSLNYIKSDLEKVDGVYEVSYVESLVESINNNITKIGIILLLFAVILILTIGILINNTIKLALFSQRFLIRSMQLVGAKHSFIIRPFLKRSFLHGVTSGIIASLLLYGFLKYAIYKVNDLNTLVDLNYLMMLFGGLMVAGGVLGFVSTYRAVNRYIKMSLDELY